MPPPASSAQRKYFPPKPSTTYETMRRTSQKSCLRLWYDACQEWSKLTSLHWQSENFVFCRRSPKDGGLCSACVVRAGIPRNQTASPHTQTRLWSLGSRMFLISWHAETFHISFYASISRNVLRTSVEVDGTTSVVSNVRFIDAVASACLLTHPWKWSELSSTIITIIITKMHGCTF